MSIIGYHKADKYIITIETEKYRTYLKEEEIKDIEYALYETKSFIIIDIEDMNGNKYDRIFDFIIDLTYNYTDLILEFFKIKELAFHLDFILNEQWQYFPDGYAGLYKEYLSNGTKVLEYYHINGIKYGKYKYYWNNNHIHEIYNYINDKKNGDFTTFYINGTIKSKGYYNNNFLKYDYYEYDDIGNIKTHQYK